MTPTPQDRATAETDLLTCDGKTLQDFLYRIFNANPQRSALCDYEAFRDAIVRQALATRPVSARALSDADVAWASDATTAEVGSIPDYRVDLWEDAIPQIREWRRSFARRIFALGASSSPDADALTAAKNAGAREALDWAAAFVLHGHDGLSIRKYRDKMYPVGPTSVRLSDGTVVNRSDVRGFFAVTRNGKCGSDVHASDWRDLAITGADFDALKQFAATLSPTGAER